MPASDGRVSRRAVLLGGAGAAVATLGASSLLAACSSSGPHFASDIALDRSGTPILAPQFDLGDPYLVTGSEQRLVFGLQAKDATGRLATDIPSPVTVTIHKGDSGRTQVGASQRITARSEGLPVGYYAVRTTFPATGTYSVDFDIEGKTVSQAVQVSTPADAKQVQRGDHMRPVETPTPGDHRGVEPICTRSPACHLHSVTLASALANHKPTAFLIATPRFCQFELCGPSLDLVIDAVASYPGIQFLHAEVYQNAAALGSIQGAKLAPVVTAYDLTYEPVLFAADADGTLIDRLDNVFDRTDLKATLDKIA